MEFDVPHDIHVATAAIVAPNTFSEPRIMDITLVFDPTEPMFVQMVFTEYDVYTGDVDERKWYVSRALIMNAIIMIGTWSGDHDVRVIVRDDDCVTVRIQDTSFATDVTFESDVMQRFVRRTLNVMSVNDEDAVITRWVDEFISQTQLDER